MRSGTRIAPAAARVLRSSALLPSPEYVPMIRFFEDCTCPVHCRIDDPPAGRLEFGPRDAVRLLGACQVGIVPDLAVTEVLNGKVVRIRPFEDRSGVGVAFEAVAMVEPDQDDLLEPKEIGELQCYVGDRPTLMDAHAGVVAEARRGGTGVDDVGQPVLLQMAARPVADELHAVQVAQPVRGLLDDVP